MGSAGWACRGDRLSRVRRAITAAPAAPRPASAASSAGPLREPIDGLFFATAPNSPRGNVIADPARDCLPLPAPLRLPGRGPLKRRGLLALRCRAPANGRPPRVPRPLPPRPEWSTVQGARHVRRVWVAGPCASLRLLGPITRIKRREPIGDPSIRGTDRLPLVGNVASTSEGRSRICTPVPVRRPQKASRRPANVWDTCRAWREPSVPRQASWLAPPQNSWERSGRSQCAVAEAAGVSRSTLYRHFANPAARGPARGARTCPYQSEPANEPRPGTGSAAVTKSWAR